MPPATADGDAAPRKRPRLPIDCPDFLDALPDDLLLLILRKLGSSSSRPSDLFTVLLTCKRMSRLALHQTVLSRASPGALAVRASRWCDEAHAFLRRCADLGNPHACYALGMIMFYCLDERKAGISMMAKAGMKRHATALYSLSVIHFNGSGALRNAKAIHVGAVLCARAALLGHLDALRELGHCLQDGYGVRRDPVRGRRYLIQANAKELASVLAPRGVPMVSLPSIGRIGRYLPAPRGDEVSRFMLEWFGAEGKRRGDEGLRMCSHSACGRRELKRHEFRRCSVCGLVNYCSRACQAVDWRLRHKARCGPRIPVAGGGAWF